LDVDASASSAVDASSCIGQLVRWLHLISGTARSLLQFSRAGRKGYSIYSRKSSVDASDENEQLPLLSFYEEQCKLEPFGGTFHEYNRLMIQIGYVVLFAPAFPFAATLCYFSFQLEMRTDAYKLLVNTQRPPYLGAQGIGSWHKVLWLLGVIAVLTNLGVIAHTSVAFTRSLPFEVVEGWKINERNKTFFLFLCEHIVLAAQYVVFVALPGIPMDLAVKRARQRWRVRTARIARDPAIAQMQHPRHSSDAGSDELLARFSNRNRAGREEGGSIADDTGEDAEKRLLYI